jgi:hypothetical protein
MARIAVLAPHQTENDQPYRFVKRSAGQSLVRRCLAYWIIENAILRMVPEREARPAKEVIVKQPFIPEKMPPGEIGGLVFEDPIKDPQQSRMMFLPRAVRLNQFEVQSSDTLEDLMQLI